MSHMLKNIKTTKNHKNTKKRPTETTIIALNFVDTISQMTYNERRILCHGMAELLP